MNIGLFEATYFPDNSEIYDSDSSLLDKLFLGDHDINALQCSFPFPRIPI